MGSRVLVVDDDDDLRIALCEALAEEGYDAAGASDGLEALNRARLEPPEVILLDLMMPGMNGWDFLVERTHDPDLSQIPVLVISAYADRQPTLLAGTSVLPKPLHFLELIGLLERLRHGPHTAGIG